MKKFSIYLLGALAVAGLASCQDESGFVDPAVNPQLPAMTDGDLVINSLIPQQIDLTGLETENPVEPVLFGRIATLNNLPEGYDLKFVGTMAREESFEHVADFEMNFADSLLTASADALEAAFVECIGKSPKQKNAYFRVAAYAVNGTASVRLGGPDAYYVTGQSLVTPLDLKIVIEDGYGLLGTVNGWSVANALPMSNGGMSGYDNPVFSIDVVITAQQANEGWWWKVVSQSCIDAGDWLSEENTQFGTQVNGDSALDGPLEGQNAQAGCIKQPGVYTFTVDMENRTYQFTPKFSILFTPGDANGWNQVNSAWMIADAGADVYRGLMALNGGFKISTAMDWNGTNYGAGAEAGMLSTDGGAGNLQGPAEQTLCYVEADITKLTYKIVPVTTVGLIGDFKDNSWASEIRLEKADDLFWTGQVTFTQGAEFKIRFNDTWDINLGGALDMLNFNGGNLVAPVSGTHDVYLDLSTVPYTLTIE